MALSNRTVTRFINHNNSSGISGTHTPSGTPDFVVLLVVSGNVPSTATYGGVACTQRATYTDYGRRVTVLTLASPASGAQTVVVNTGTAVTVWCVTYTGVDIAGTPYIERVGRNFGGAIPSSYSEAVTSAASSELLGIVGSTVTAAYTRGGSQTALTGSPVLTDNDGRGSDAWYAPGGTTPVTGTTASFELCAIAVFEILETPPPAGPTITVQPVADTVILTNENTASFSVTATGTGGLTYDWELETSVGGGVYANLADGNGATWTGQAASSCTATLTAKTLTGRRVRCNVTDSNGTTTTNAVALTIFDGPQLTAFPATNGSGVSTATLTCDYVTGVGEAVEVRIPLSDGDVAVTVTTT